LAAYEQLAPRATFDLQPASGIPSPVPEDLAPGVMPPAPFDRQLAEFCRFVSCRGRLVAALYPRFCTAIPPIYIAMARTVSAKHTPTRAPKAVVGASAAADCARCSVSNQFRSKELPSLATMQVPRLGYGQTSMLAQRAVHFLHAPIS